MKENAKINAIILYLLIMISSAAIPLALCWVKKRYALHHQRSMNSVSKSLLFSAMLQSWMWFGCLYGYQFRALSLFKDFLRCRSAVVSTAYMHLWILGTMPLGSWVCCTSLSSPSSCGTSAPRSWAWTGEVWTGSSACWTWWSQLGVQEWCSSCRWHPGTLCMPSLSFSHILCL